MSRGPETYESRDPLSYGNLSAEKLPAESGITVKPASLDDILRITSRDLSGGSYPYNVGFTNRDRRRENLVFWAKEVEVGYLCLGLKKCAGITEGEIGMLHLAPAVRGLGLSTMLGFFGYLRLVKNGAEQLRVVLAREFEERTTKLHFELGFRNAGEKHGFDQEAVLRKPIVDRQQTIELLGQKLQQRASRLPPNLLGFDPLEIDYDNPKKVSLEETVRQRLDGRGYFFNDNFRTLFGYPLSPLRLDQENDLQKNTLLTLQLYSPSPIDGLAGEIKKQADQNHLRFFRPSRTTCEIESSKINTNDEMNGVVHQLATIGNQFVKILA